MMNTDRTLTKFYATFDEWPVAKEWQTELLNYYVRGIPPGSFHTALFENNLVAAALRSHQLNTWTAIADFMKWVLNKAPGNSWGSKENVQSWLALSADERRRICEEVGILASAWELLKEPHNEQ